MASKFPGRGSRSSTRMTAAATLCGWRIRRSLIKLSARLWGSTLATPSRWSRVGRRGAILLCGYGIRGAVWFRVCGIGLYRTYRDVKDSHHSPGMTGTVVTPCKPISRPVAPSLKRFLHKTQSITCELLLHRVLTVLSGAWGAVRRPASRSQAWSKMAAEAADDSQSDWHMHRGCRHRPLPLLSLAARPGPAQAAAPAVLASARSTGEATLRPWADGVPDWCARLRTT